MATKTKKSKRGVAVRVHVPEPLNEKIELFQAQERLNKRVVTKEQIILEKTEAGLATV